MTWQPVYASKAQIVYINLKTMGSGFFIAVFELAWPKKRI
jgi:hypothetical protein